MTCDTGQIRLNSTDYSFCVLAIIRTSHRNENFFRSSSYKILYNCNVQDLVTRWKLWSSSQIVALSGRWTWNTTRICPTIFQRVISYRIWRQCVLKVWANVRLVYTRRLHLRLDLSCILRLFFLQSKIRSHLDSLILTKLGTE